MRIAGFDPGIGRTGVAIVDASPRSLTLVHAECIETEVGADEGVRLHAIWATTAALVMRYSPEAAAVEELFFSSNRRSAMRVAQARGVVLAALAAHGLVAHEYTPMQVKESVAGWGGARKAQVARMAAALLGVDTIPGPDDVTDACAVAICHRNRGALQDAAARANAATLAANASVLGTAGGGLAAAIARAKAAS